MASSAGRSLWAGYGGVSGGTTRAGPVSRFGRGPHPAAWAVPMPGARRSPPPSGRSVEDAEFAVWSAEAARVDSLGERQLGLLSADRLAALAQYEAVAGARPCSQLGRRPRGGTREEKPKHRRQLVERDGRDPFGLARRPVTHMPEPSTVLSHSGWCGSERTRWWEPVATVLGHFVAEVASVTTAMCTVVDRCRAPPRATRPTGVARRKGETSCEYRSSEVSPSPRWRPDCLYQPQRRRRLLCLSRPPRH